jgi:YD repeat-containing protein
MFRWINNYDGWRVLTETDVDDDSDPNIVETYDYDARGLMVRAYKGTAGDPDATSISEFSYNDLGYLTGTEQGIKAGVEDVYLTGYERDQLGQAIELTYPYNSTPDTVLAMSYTSLGKIDKIYRDPQGSNTLLADYNYAGNFVRQRIYDVPDVTFTPTYDGYGRVTEHKTENITGDIVSYSYTYDNNGNILTQVFDHRTSDPVNNYTYDDLDRLTAAVYLGDPNDNEVFTYDKVGNRENWNNRAGNNVVYEHNVANEYTSIDQANLSHDAAGNLSVDENGYHYYYDYENRLTKITDPNDINSIAEFVYDALGRRVQAILYDGGVANSTTNYYYDGWRVLTETDVDGETESHLRDYIYGNYLDDVLVKTEDEEDIYYTHDHLFSVVALINEDGDVLERYEYDAYGKPYFYDPNFVLLATQESGHGNKRLFTGKAFILSLSDLKLQDNLNRIYNFERWLQRDPIGERDGICIVYFADSGSPQIKKNKIRNQYTDGASLYEYVRSNTMSIIDPLGLTSVIGPDVMPDGEPPADPSDISDPSDVILPEPPKLKSIGSFDCCKNVLQAIEVVNEAVQTPGGCWEWFQNHSSTGEVYSVRVRGNWRGMCALGAFFYTWPVSNDIAACERSCDESVFTNALLLLHEIGHHYGPTFAGFEERDDEASKPMYACQNAVNNIVNKKK